MFPSKLTKAALASGTALTLALATLAAPGQSLADTEPFIGDIQYIGFNFAPRNWLFCDGQLISISSNQALFALLGTTFGGDGRTTYALPDMRGRVPIHVGSGPGLSTYSWGQKGGVEQVTLSVNQMPSHSHTLNATASRGNEDDPGGTAIARDNREEQFHDSNTPNVAMKAGSIGNAGTSQAHENRMPFLAVYCTIALTGVFPSRN